MEKRGEDQIFNLEPIAQPKISILYGRRSFLGLMAITAGTVTLGACGYRLEKDDPPSALRSDRLQNQPAPSPTEQAQLYFPVILGSQWTYKITTGEVEPIYYQEITWMMNENRGMTYETRGRFVSLLRQPSPKSFALSLTVESRAPKQGPLEYPGGAKLRIDKDELGVFKDSKEIFWAMSLSRGLRVLQVNTYSPDMIGAPTGSFGMPVAREGFSTRLVFFGEKPGIGIGMGDKPKEKLFFVEATGSDLHFVREVGAGNPGQGPTDILERAFTEDMWFQKNVGLRRLEQKIGGKTSMVWDLTQFSQPNKQDKLNNGSLY